MNPFLPPKLVKRAAEEEELSSIFLGDTMVPNIV